jgi:hypothetical protein
VEAVVFGPERVDEEAAQKLQDEEPRGAALPAKPTSDPTAAPKP